MGLDITAYKDVRLAPEAPKDEDGWPTEPGHTRFYINPDFTARAVGVEDKAVYAFDDSTDFRAGSYSGYGAWREELAKLAGYKAVYSESRKTDRYDAGAWATESGPFWELINFSDCEGVIGPIVAAKLAKDFAEWDERAKAHIIDGWFYDRYTKWRQAFEMAAHTGAVAFH